MRQFVISTIFMFSLALSGGETKLGGASFKLASHDRSLTVLARGGNASDAPELLLKFSNAAAPVTLQTRGLLPDAAIKKEEPLSISELALDTKASGLLVTFSLVDSRGHVRAIAAALQHDASGWKVMREWSADCYPLGEAGYIRQKQSFSAKAGTLIRQLKNARVEGVMYTLDCGCPACASKTTEYVEDETWTWSSEKGTMDRTHFEKRYIVQPTEGLLSVARKAYGDARMMGKLLKLNPSLKNETVLKEGQGIVVEREGK
ncbi:MAG TPA: hypothetical protein VEJ63_15120 [Planctomycetota bacterium]|nr:hypothetical protein [Planctomycetota bacterium]